MSSWQDLRDRFLQAAEQSRPGTWLPLWRLIIEHPWYQRELSTIAAQVLRSQGVSPEWREDLEHDAVLLLARKLQKTPHLKIDRAVARDHFAGFLAVLTRRDCLQALRRLRRQYGPNLELPEVAVADESRAAQAALADLSVAIDRLDDLHRAVLLLSAKGRQLRQIAAELRLSYSKTCRLYHSGLERLRSLF